MIFFVFVDEQDSSFLLKAAVRIVDKSYCRKFTDFDKEAFTYGFDSDVSVCAGDLSENGNDTCQVEC